MSAREFPIFFRLFWFIVILIYENFKIMSFGYVRTPSLSSSSLRKCHAGQIKSLSMFFACLPNFFYDRVLRYHSPNSSEGEHIVGHRWPLLSFERYLYV